MNNQNSVFLIDFMGGDRLHGLGAWASTFAEFGIDMPTNIENRVDCIVDYILNNGTKKRSLQELLEFLASENHSSPFRLSSFVFGFTTDLATHVQKLKHKVILEAENGESARYKELKEDKFYLPEDWYGVMPTDSKVKREFGNLDWYEILKQHTQKSNFLYHTSLKDLNNRLGKARAKETARYFKTYNSQINTINKFSFDGIMQFYQKRNTTHAQKEIAEIAESMVKCIKEIPNNPFEYSLKAFGL